MPRQHRAFNLPMLLGYGLLLLLMFFSAFCLITEQDIPWYLRTGEEILRRGSIPRVDPFSYTSHQVWLNHEWLAQIILAIFYRIGGLAGVTLWQALVFTATVATLIWSSVIQKRHLGLSASISTSLAPVSFAFVALLLRELISPRAQLISNLFFALTLSLALQDWLKGQFTLDKPGKSKLYLTLGIGLLWTQIHGGNPNGVILLALLFLSRPTLRRAGYTTIALLLTCAGPFGFQVHRHFFEAQGLITAIREWHSLPQALQSNFTTYAPFVLLFLVAAVILIYRQKQGQPVRFQTLVMLVYTIAAVRYVRFIAEATLVSATIIAPAMADFFHKQQERFPRLFQVASFAIAIFIFGTGVIISGRALGIGWAPWRFPIDAVEFLKRTRPQGPMFNSYNFGGYLMWRYPEERVFIDGRAFTVYSPTLFHKLLEVYDNPNLFRELQRQYGFRLAVLQRHGRGAGLLTWLKHQKEWQVQYEDPLAAVLTRDVRQ